MSGLLRIAPGCLRVLKRFNITQVFKLHARPLALQKNKPLLSRDLDGYEQFLTVFHERGNHVNTGALGIASKSKLPVDSILVALNVVQHKHPILGMTIQSEGTGIQRTFKFVEMENKHVNFAVVENETWQSVFEQQIAERFDVVKGPLWRVRLVREPVASFALDDNYKYPYMFVCAFHHATSDGGSLYTLFTDIFHYMVNAVNGKIEEPAHMPLIPPMEEYLRNYMETLKRDMFFQSNMKISQSKHDEEKHKDEIIAEKYENAFIQKYSAEILRSPDTEIALKIIHTEFNLNDSLELLRSCKKNGSTVTGAVVAAMTLAMAELLIVDNPSQSVVIPVQLPVNLRSLVPGAPGAENVTYCTSLLQIDVLVAKEDHRNFWNLAKSCTAQIKSGMKEGRPIRMFLDTAEMIKTDPEALQQSDNLGVRTTKLLLKVSSMAHFNLPLDDMLSCRLVSFSNNNCMDGPVFYAVIATKADSFFVDMTYYTQLTTRSMANSFTNRVLGILLSNVRGDDSD